MKNDEQVKISHRGASAKWTSNCVKPWVNNWWTCMRFTANTGNHAWCLHTTSMLHRKCSMQVESSWVELNWVELSWVQLSRYCLARNLNARPLPNEPWLKIVCKGFGHLFRYPPQHRRVRRVVVLLACLLATCLHCLQIVQALVCTYIWFFLSASAFNGFTYERWRLTWLVSTLPRSWIESKKGVRLPIFFQDSDGLCEHGQSSVAAVPGSFLYFYHMIYHLEKKNSTCSHGISLSRLWGDDLDDALFSEKK